MNRIWRQSSMFAAGTTLLMFVYSSLHYGALATHKLQEVFAVAAVIVIAPSLFLSGLAYFWNFADKYIVYRKSLGLLGFYLGLVHVGISMVRTGVLTDAFALTSWHSVSIVAGYVAVVLFALMPLCSNPVTIRRIGGPAVRVALRYLGYAAFALVLWHVGILYWDVWVAWYTSFDPLLPPPSLVAFEIGVATLLLRIGVFVAELTKSRVA